MVDNRCANRHTFFMAERKKYPTAKPHPTFPLTPRADGRFVKKIRGQLHCFGRNGDWREAFAEYTQLAGALHAGRPKPVSASELSTVREVAFLYLAEREHDVTAGALSLGGWDDYRAALKRFVQHIGASTPASTLCPADFAAFAKSIRPATDGTKRKGSLGSYAYNKTRALIFAWLRHSAKAEWVKPINFGVGFPKVAAGKIRGDRRGKLFTPADIALLLGIARGQLYAMILLGINGGFGGTDCSELTKDRVDLAAGVIRYKRRKTNISRTVTLWPETVAALTPLLTIRPDDEHVFRTSHGKRWVRTEQIGAKVVTKDSIAVRFRRLLDSVCLLGESTKGTMSKQRPGMGFYALRHTFATYANEIRDSDARLHLMGRALPGIDGDAYIEELFLPRLKIVTDHVRARLLG